MKSLIKLFMITGVAAAFSGCEKKSDGNYFGAVPNPIVSLLDIRPLYKGQDVALTPDNVYGGNTIAAVVVSEHTEGNLPAGLLIVQDRRRLELLRGISIDLGAAAANYHPGDSLWIKFSSGTLTRRDGVLTITGLNESNITSKGKGLVSINAVTVAQLNATPSDFESTLCLVNKASFTPAPVDGETISGAKNINDGFGNLVLQTEPTVSYANTTPFGLAAYVGIPFRTSEGTIEYRTRQGSDMINMGNSAQDLFITGLQTDPRGGDGGYEYVQMMATKDIDFSVTPYSLVFNNNAGTASSANPLDAGWATGGQRTIKWDITSGKAIKGGFFYFIFQGRKINGSGGAYSFPVADNIFEATYLTSGTNQGDGGLVRPSTYGTSGPFANSGNTCGVGLFKGTTVTEASVPADVLFIATGGGAAVYNAATNLGYRICNNDWYSMYSVVIDQTTFEPIIEPYLFYRSAGNAASMPYPVNNEFPTAATDQGLFHMMGGVYNTTLGRWTTARTQNIVHLVQATATIDTLEKHRFVTRIVE